MNNKKSVAEFLKISRTISAEHLPIGHSFIPFDLLLHVYLHHTDAENDPLTMKALLASLPYSDMGVRYHLRRLIDRDWISIGKNPHDLRISSVTATRKTISAFDLIAENMAPHLDVFRTARRS